MKSLIITWENFQDQELVYPYYRLQEEGTVHVMSNVVGKFFGIMGVNMESDLKTSQLNDGFYDEYDFLVLPGGVKALEKLRQEKNVLDFIAGWNERDKVIASTCHGAQLLISAKVVRGRKISGYYSLKDDIENAGAIYVDAPCVVDGNIASSPHYKWSGLWMKGAIDIYNARQHCREKALGV